MRCILQGCAAALPCVFGSSPPRQGQLLQLPTLPTTCRPANLFSTTRCFLARSQCGTEQPPRGPGGHNPPSEPSSQPSAPLAAALPLTCGATTSHGQGRGSVAERNANFADSCEAPLQRMDVASECNGTSNGCSATPLSTAEAATGLRVGQAGVVQGA